MKTDIYLVGQDNLQNQLLKYFLSMEFGFECGLGCDLDIVPPEPDPEKAAPTLVLWDCISYSETLLGKELDNGFVPLHTHCYFALYNCSPDATLPRSMLQKGVRGIFFETDSPSVIVKGIKKIAEGELWLTREAMTNLVLETPPAEDADLTPNPLTPRERQVLALLAAGKSNQEIADDLCVSLHTVKTHIYNIFQKIGVTNRFQAALWAGKHL